VSRLVKALDSVESHNAHLLAENHELKQALHQLVFGGEEETAADGLPLPPAGLRYLVAGTTRLESFLNTGRLAAQLLGTALARQGRTLSQCRRVLDFGCGCGRVLRHLSGTSGCEFYGTDCNAQAISWGRSRLPFAQYQVNSQEPPLGYADGMFSLIYAFSIFTHLTQTAQARWMAELRRLLSPDGYLLITLHGDARVESLPEADRRE
jgi:SAM-dependent methyltransferase